MPDDRPPFDVSSRQDEGGLFLAVRGEIDMATGDEFRAELLAAVAGGGRVVVDLSGIAFMDSTGLGVIIDAAKKSRYGDLVIRAPSRPVRRLFDVSGVAPLFVLEIPE